MAAIAHPIPPVAHQRRAVPGGRHHRRRAAHAKALKRLPVPVSTPGFDAAPYLTATLCVTRDPESGVRTWAPTASALKAADRAVVRMVAREATGAGGFLHWLKYRERKQKMPIAIVVGAAPIVMFTGPQKLAVDMDEMAVAGGAAGEAIRMTRCRTIDLDVPADSEIVVEGLIDCDVLEPEAPFGESNGYVALEAYNMPIEVTAITHKKKPVFAQIISQVTPSESSVIKKVAYEPLFLAHLKTQLGVKGIRRVVMHERLTNLRPVIFLQFAAGTPRTEVWRGLQGASTLQSNCGKIVIAVSEDIDPSSMDAVLWSLAYRTNPVDDMHIVPNRGGVQGAQYAGNKTDSGLLVDATRKRAMPPLALPTREYMEHARALWEELGLARAQRAGAVARLHARRLDRHLGDLRAPHHGGRLGGNRPRDAEAPAPRAVARDAGAAGRRAGQRLTARTLTTWRRNEWRAFPISSNPTCLPSIRTFWRGRSRSTARWRTARTRRRR